MLKVVGASTDMMIAGTIVATLGVGISVTSVRIVTTDPTDSTEDMTCMIGLVANQANIHSAAREIAESITNGGTQDRLVRLSEEAVDGQVQL